MSVIGNTSEINAVLSYGDDRQVIGASFNDDRIFDDRASSKQLSSATYSHQTVVSYNKVVIGSETGPDTLSQTQQTYARVNSMSFNLDNETNINASNLDSTVTKTVDIEATTNSTALHRRDITYIFAAAGEDVLTYNLDIYSTDGSTASYDDNDLYTFGGAGNDTMMGAMFAQSVGGESGTSYAGITYNTVGLASGQGNDLLTFDVSVGGIEGEAEFFANSIVLNADVGQDTLTSTVSVRGDTTFRQNSITLGSSEGNDLMALTLDVGGMDDLSKFQMNIFSLLGDGGDDVMALRIKADDYSFIDQNQWFISGGKGSLDTFLLTLEGDPTAQNIDVRTGLLSGIRTIGVEQFGITLVNEVGDTIIGGARRDTLNGGGGDDLLIGGAGDDTYYVDSLGDTVQEVAGEGFDTIVTSIDYALTPGRSIEALKGNDLVAGLTLTGDDGVNTLIASSLGSTLIGGLGADRLFGGAGRDTFVFLTDKDSIAGSERDAIIGFVTGSDLIDVSGIQAVRGASTDQAFTFLGTAAYTGQAGQLQALQSGTSTLLRGDLNGDQKTDFQILLADTAATSLSTSDFIL